MQQNEAGQNRRISRRDFLRGAAVATGVLAVAACTPIAPGATSSPGAGSAAPAAEKPKITVWTSATFTTDADALQDEQITGWCAENGVELDLSRFAGDAIRPNWQAAFESRQFPDIGNIPQEDLAKFILTDVMLETTDLVEALNEKEGGYTNGAYGAGRTPDGKHWSVPSFSSTEIFYVRKDKLDEKGLDIPETWEDVLATAKEITVPGEFWGWGTQIGTPSWDSEVAFTSKLWSYGGKTWDENSQPAIDSEETRTTINLLKDAWDAGVVPPDAAIWDDSGNNKAYLTGIVGMVFNTGSILRAMQADDPDLLDRTAVIPIPKGPKGRFCSGYNYQWGGFNKTEHPEVVRGLLEYLFAPEQLRPYYEAGGGNLLPVYKDMINDEMWQDPYRKVLAEMIADTYSQGNPGLTTPWVLDAWIDHTMVKMLGRVLFDDWDNDKAIEEANAALTKWYDDWQTRLQG
ncbi:MAG: substrate-binding domain-containing protein [Caldilineaceae bacterium]